MTTMEMVEKEVSELRAKAQTRRDEATEMTERYHRMPSGYAKHMLECSISDADAEADRFDREADEIEIRFDEDMDAEAVRQLVLAARGETAAA